MKIIMAGVSKIGKIETENAALLSLLLHTLLWFVLGAGAGYIMTGFMRASEGMRVSYMVTAGSVCALVFGYICGVVYLLRREA